VNLRYAVTALFFLLAGLTFGPVSGQAQTLGLPALDTQTAAQFAAVGRFGPDGFASQGCTGTLIAPDLVLTAAHCAAVSGKSDNVFAAGWSGQGALAQRASAQEQRHPDYAPDGRHTPQGDIALITLAAPIDDIAPLALSLARPETLDGSVGAVVGYHIRRPDVLNGDLDCPLSRLGTGLLLVGCPVLNGNSGGPVLQRGADGDWEIVGVISSRLGAGAIAVALPPSLAVRLKARAAQ